MSEYTRWQMLNEALGFPLGVKSAASMGIAGGFAALEEAKKKKMALDMGDGDGDDEDDVEVDLDDDDDEDEDEDLGSGEEVDVGDEDDEEGEVGPKISFGKGEMMMKKKMSKCGMKKKMSGCKHMKKEDVEALKNDNKDIFSQYRDVAFEETPEIGSEEYREKFFQSIAGHASNPDRNSMAASTLAKK
jgi:hypothetical protein